MTDHIHPATRPIDTAEYWREIAGHRSKSIEQLLARIQQLETEEGQVIDERDHAQAMADKLAAAIAPPDVLGEHSSSNNPWQNALDYARGDAEYTRRRTERLPLRCPGCGSADPVTRLLVSCGLPCDYDWHEATS